MPKQENITLSMKETKVYQTMQKVLGGTLSSKAAAKILNYSTRHIRRLKPVVKKKGLKGLIHKSRGRPGNRKLASSLLEKVKKLITEKYKDFKPTHLSEQLVENHKIKISKETVRRILVDLGLHIPKPIKQKQAYRSWRARRTYFGEMQQYDGCKHRWFQGKEGLCSLLLSVDDATGRVTHAEFADDEGVWATFSFWLDYLLKHGKPKQIYLDRFSTYSNNSKKNTQEVLELTQFQRACKTLGIGLIHARSPQGKGRIERLIQSFQNRLPNELKLHNIRTRVAAQKYLTQVFIPKYDLKFSVTPALEGDVHESLSTEETINIASIFSLQETRKVQNDYTLQFQNSWYQLKSSAAVIVRSGDTVTVEVRKGGEIAIRKNTKLLEYLLLPERPKKIQLEKSPKAIIPRPQRESYSWKAQDKARRKNQEQIKELTGSGHF